MIEKETQVGLNSSVAKLSRVIKAYINQEIKTSYPHDELQKYSRLARSCAINGIEWIERERNAVRNQWKDQGNKYVIVEKFNFKKIGKGIKGMLNNKGNVEIQMITDIP